MIADTSRHQKQVQEAEELIFSGPQRTGFVKALFLGRFEPSGVMPFPRLDGEERTRVESAIAEVQRFVDEELDPAAIDRDSEIPQAIVERLGELGVLGMSGPEELGGRGFSQMAYCRIMEIIGGRCASTSVFVNAHHSIGIRALLLFGTDMQKRKWLPSLVNASRLAAFALTEPEAGSDAGNVQTTATPSNDGQSYILNGEKQYITNGSIADVLTVMARTPIPGKEDTAITAFLVTPDMPGFEIVEPRMEKLGIRGTVTSRLAFHDMPVPAENVLGPLGKGLKVALTVLDFGRTTFGACCTGAAKTCLKLTVAHVEERRQFGRSLAEFELVQKKIGAMASYAYAMEAMTQVTAGLIDSELEDYMLETAILKVFSTEALWGIVNDAFQIHGGAAYFTDLPLERMLRDARINQIGEGANDVLRCFIALVGMRNPGEQLKEIWDALHEPWSELRNLWRHGLQLAETAVRSPELPVHASILLPHQQKLSRLIRRFGQMVRRTLVRYGEDVLDRQLVQEKIAEAAMELYASACVLSRLDFEIKEASESDGGSAAIPPAAEYFLRSSSRRIEANLIGLRDNDDDALLAAASSVVSEKPEAD
jgi:alkylation response protein AidB-like acyl-CoA dehydrogenase